MDLEITIEKGFLYYRNLQNLVNIEIFVWMGFFSVREILCQIINSPFFSLTWKILFQTWTTKKWRKGRFTSILTSISFQFSQRKLLLKEIFFHFLNVCFRISSDRIKLEFLFLSAPAGKKENVKKSLIVFLENIKNPLSFFSYTRFIRKTMNHFCFFLHKTRKNAL